MQHLAFRRVVGTALKVDDGTAIRRNHRNLLEINLNTLVKNLRKLERTWPDLCQTQHTEVSTVAIVPLDGTRRLGPSEIPSGRT